MDITNYINKIQSEIDKRNAEIEKKLAEISVREKTLDAKSAEIDTKRSELAKETEEIQVKRGELKSIEDRILTSEEVVRIRREIEIERMKSENARKEAFEALATVKQKEKELGVRELELSRKAESYKAEIEKELSHTDLPNLLRLFNANRK